ncbi:MAG TPA: hypothetical protein PKI03_37695 [Pseudomonadota bacterium]|nr:hypothetical protein [Pseudomonadota bacterium]
MHIPMFVALPPDERRDFVERYLRFLRERDGVLDHATGQLSRREAGLRALQTDPIRRSGPAVVEQRVYDENAVKSDVAVQGLDPWTLWAICISKCSRMEEYAVRYLEASGRSRLSFAEDPYSFIDLEERYHSRLLESLHQVIGITPGFRHPPLLSRLGLLAILAVPKAMSNITVLCGEIIGVATFLLFLQSARTLCADQPQARARLEFIIKEILTDEIGHVLFLRSQLGPFRLALARGLLPIIARVLIAGYPEMRWLYGSRRLLDAMLDPRLLDRVLAEVGGLPLLTMGADSGRTVSAEGLLKT